MRTPAISGPRPLTYNSADGIAGPLDRMVFFGSNTMSEKCEVVQWVTAFAVADCYGSARDLARSYTEAAGKQCLHACDTRIVKLIALSEEERLLIASSADEWEEHAQRWRDNDNYGGVADASDRNAAVLRSLLQRSLLPEPAAGLERLRDMRREAGFRDDEWV